MPTLSRISADLLLLLHLAFILFVLLGGLLVLRKHWILYLHLPAVLWGTLVECLGWYCPLTPLEQHLRRLHDTSYQSSFMEHYLVPLLYPATLTRSMQIGFGLVVVGVNAVIYGWLLWRQWKKKSEEEPAP